MFDVFMPPLLNIYNVFKNEMIDDDEINLRMI